MLALPQSTPILFYPTWSQFHLCSSHNFYVRKFCVQLFCACILGFVFYWCKNVGAKAVRRMLMKLKTNKEMGIVKNSQVTSVLKQVLLYIKYLYFYMVKFENLTCQIFMVSKMVWVTGRISCHITCLRM